MRVRSRLACLLSVLLALTALRAESAELVDFALTSGGQRIDALVVDTRGRTPPLVVLVGGLSGDDASSAAVRDAVAAYEKGSRQPFRLIAIPVANPERVPLAFPPTGVAYRENAEANALWRYLGAQAPDLVLIAGGEDHGLAVALGKEKVADMGAVPARAWDGTPLARIGAFPKSAARVELDRRRARTPHQLAVELGRKYGRDFDQPWYIGAIALQARIALGNLDDVRRLVEPYVDGRKDSLTSRPNSLVMAGHIVFTDLARATKDPRYVAMVRKIADLGFDERGQMRESMPYHDQFSDSVFMGTAIVAQAGALTGDRKYFDLADRHLRFMERLDLRPDGLYRHEPATDAPWGRGNGFAAIGLAMSLAEMPKDHPGYAHLLQSYRNLMKALLPWQNRDGLWRNVVNVPGTYAEFSSTAMIGYAMKRGLDQGWLRGRDYRAAVDRAWVAVNSRTSSAGTFIDMCESTAKMKSFDDYLKRAAILGEDPRAGAMAMQFAIAMDR